MLTVKECKFLLYMVEFENITISPRGMELIKEALENNRDKIVEKREDLKDQIDEINWLMDSDWRNR